MIKSSTGLAQKMLVTEPFRDTMNLCTLKIYSATDEPDDADAAVVGTLLLTITNNSTATGLTWEIAAEGRTVKKTTSETWSGVVAANGTAKYFRIVAAGDTGVAATTETPVYRVQGSVGNGATSDLFFTNPILASGDTKTLAAFSVELPSP